MEQAIVSRIDRLGRKYLMALKCASVAGNDFVDEVCALPRARRAAAVRCAAASHAPRRALARAARVRARRC